jgi:hypothetical protein
VPRPRKNPLPPIGYTWESGSKIVGYPGKDKWGHEQAEILCGSCGETRRVTTLKYVRTGLCQKCTGQRTVALQHAWKVRKTQVQERIREQLSSGVKLCTCCKRSLALSSFNRLTRSRDGLNHDCSECQQNKKRDNLYGFAPGEYERLVLAQRGKCAIDACSRPLEVVDHCHHTGKVRGLLCHQHNVALHASFTAEDLRAMAEYLESHQTSDVAASVSVTRPVKTLQEHHAIRNV